MSKTIDEPKILSPANRKQHCESLKEYSQLIPWLFIDNRKQPHAIHRTTENTMSWSNPDNWSSFRDASLVAEDPQLKGIGFVLQDTRDPYQDPTDPFYFIDLDDVRDPDTGVVHPVALELVERADTYTAISTSGAGLHIIGKGSLPEDVKTIQADLPEQSDFQEASIEVYDGKRFIALTGKHVEGTPTEARDAEELLHELADEYVSEEERYTPGVDGEEWEPEHDRDEIQDIETTTRLGVIINAIKHVKPEDIHLNSKKTEGRGGSDYSFDPSWEPSDSGTRLGYDDDEMGWIYRRGDVSIDALQVVALEENIISSPHQYPEGRDWWQALEKLRDRGANIPYFDVPAWDTDVPTLYRVAHEHADELGDNITARPVSQIPTGQLDALSPDDRRRAAQNRGLDWPDTDTAREDLRKCIHTVMQYEENDVVDAPTSLGKTFTVASERWAARNEITGERPVIHLLETHEARDEAQRVAERNGGAHMKLLGRREACPVCSGSHDPQNAGSRTQVVTVNGVPASEMIDHLCEHKGLPFSVAHSWAEDNCDQEIEELPCGSDDCPAITQWERLREGPDGDPDSDQNWPLVIATHNFAYTPGLRWDANIVIDELPDYRTELSTTRVRDAVNAFLKEIDAPEPTWEAFITLSQHDGAQGGGKELADTMQKALDEEPAREWYLEDEDAHVLAPALARAIWFAEERANGRRAARVPHSLPRFDASARSDNEWNREWVTVVMNDQNDIEVIRAVPDFSMARSVVGLDAHPAEPVWEANTLPWIESRSVLDAEEGQLWRRYERGLRVVQVGGATRPRSGSNAREWFDDDAVTALFEHLRSEYGTGFRTAVTTSQIERRLREIMEEVGIDEPETMHYGEEKSRNDFAGEPIGFVNGCMDPGDDYVLNLLAELNLDAEPETTVNEDGEEYRARGRGFTGDDANSAEAILASVRENHVAQAAGRYARNPNKPDDNATVFVRTDAAPTGFVDVQVPGVQQLFTDTQQDVVETVRDAEKALTTQEIADKVGCTREYVRQLLETLHEETGSVQKSPGEGENGATLYADDGLPHRGVIDTELNQSESPTTAYYDSSKWQLEISSPSEEDSPLSDSSDKKLGKSSQEGDDTTVPDQWWKQEKDGNKPDD